MRMSGTGALVGAITGFIARGAVVLLNLGTAGMLALPSAAIGALVGGIAGGSGRPLRGALIGAVLSGVVFEFFMFACASVVGMFSHQAGAQFLAQTLVYTLEMAAAGAVAGGLGGMAGLMSTPEDPSAGAETPAATHPPAESREEEAERLRARLAELERGGREGEV